MLLCMSVREECRIENVVEDRRFKSTRALSKKIVAISHRTTRHVRFRLANLVQHASHNASWPVSSVARDWKLNSITSCRAFSISFSSVMTSSKKNFETCQQEIQDANWASLESWMQRLNHDHAGHTIDPESILQNGALCLLITLRNRKSSSSVTFISHTSMNLTGDRAFVREVWTS